MEFASDKLSNLLNSAYSDECELIWIYELTDKFRPEGPPEFAASDFLCGALNQHT